ncbi:T9SS type A sorting domain-containing protein [Empedobacter brevis]|uniref:T9SS type A sorting domain-containing protein n=1 Tax=Empedobacter brevis TaxID=247 RepID=UPI0028A170AC|nr:T9SS type A sorting domain-containing protein [Empedobacter brevis]
MNKLFTFLATLLPILGISQSSIEAQLYDIGKKGNSEMKNLRISENQLFFTGKEFWHSNFARYNFDTKKFTTFNTDQDNSRLNNENIPYSIIKDEIFYVFEENNYVVIKKGLKNGTVETFFETPTRISNFKQFGKDKFIFSTVHYKTQGSTFERLWISDGTKEGTKNIFETEPSYSNINFIDNIEDRFYFVSTNKTYSVNSKTNEIKEYFSYLYNPLFIFKNKIHYFKYNYQTNEQDLYVINGENSSEKVATLSNDNIGNDIRYHIVGDNVYIYTNINSTFYVDSFLYEYNSQKQTIKKIFEKPVREIQNIFDYNGEFYFSTYTEDSKYFNYKIEGDKIIEMHYLTKDNIIYNPIIYDDKLFIANNGKISYYNFLAKELTDLNNEYYQAIYYTYFKNPFIYNNELYFVSSDELNGEELFKYNKDKNTKDIVFNYNSSEGSSPNNFSKIGDNILFFANGNILHQHNPKSKQFEVLFDENNNFIKSTGAHNKAQRISDKSIAFVTDSLELGLSDGTKQGTFIYQKRSSNENYLQTHFSNLIPFKNKIIFTGTTKYKGDEPWITDGTREGTFMLKDIYDGYESSSPSLHQGGYTILKDKLYFTANPTGIYTTSIIETDGTKEGTKEIYNTTGYGNNLEVYDNFQEKLVIVSDNYGQLFDPDTKNITDLQIEDKNFQAPFVWNNRIYFRHSYKGYHYIDENLEHYFLKDMGNNILHPILQVGNDLYLKDFISDYSYNIYKLTQNNELEKYDEYITYIKTLKNKLYYLNYFDSDQTEIQLNIINEKGHQKYKINFEDKLENHIYTGDFEIIDNKLYLSKTNKLYGEELYIIDLPKDLLSSNEINQQINIKSYYTIYPNPSSDYFKIRAKNNDNLSIIIFDISGKKIKTVNVKTESEIKINHLPKGIYIIHIDNGKQKENKKLIIQ